MMSLSVKRVRELLQAASQTRVLVLGDLILDQFIWGHVVRISPEAPVPIVEFDRESFMPGGAANVARNLTNLKSQATLLGVVGQDDWGKTLRELLQGDDVECDGMLVHPERPTSLKTRIIAHQQQVVRVDRETNEDLDRPTLQTLLEVIEKCLPSCSAVIIGDYGKGVVTQELLDQVKHRCRRRGVWLSLDPKPTHCLNLSGLSLITPNRKEAFALAGVSDSGKRTSPLQDENLLQVSERLLSKLQPAVLLITLGEHGMLLRCRDQKPFHIPTVAQEVFDVSGAGDTVIASFTLAIAAGASPFEAAVFSNHAAGVVVGKVGTATVTPEELVESFRRKS